MDLKRKINVLLFILYYELINYLIAVKYLFIEIQYKLGYKRHLNVDTELPQKLSHRVAIVTGGTRGLGLSVVQTLVRKGCSVFVATSQRPERYQLMMDKIYENMPVEGPDGTRRGVVQLEHVDLSSMDSVKKFADAFQKTGLKLNYLICNAGIMFAPRAITPDGFESHLAVNYLGHCLLIMELLPMLKRTADETSINSRIVNVSSATHFSTDFRFHDLKATKYSSHQAYAQTKLAQIMFTYKLDRTLRDHLNWHNVQIMCLHPGVVLSDLYEHVGVIKYLPFLVPLIKLVTRDIVQGAETTLYASLSDELRNVSGVYLEDCTIKKSSRASKSFTSQEKLWHVTHDLLEPWMPKSWYKMMESTFE